MIRRPLSVLPAAVAGTAALSLVSAFAMAQGAATKPKSEPPPAHPAPQAAVSSNDTVVGTCNAHKVTWGQLVARITEDNPIVLQQSVSAIVSSKASEAFYGTSPKETFTITKAQAISELREHPNSAISQQLELMLTQFAVDDEAAKQNVQPTQKDVDDKIAALLKSLRDNKTIPANQTDTAFLKEHNTTLEKLKTVYRPQVQLLNLIHKDLVKQLGHSIGPEDLVQVSHIVIQPSELKADATDEEKKKADVAALARAREIEGEIKSGKVKFADEAKASSDDPQTKEQGGNVGIILRGTTVYGKEFETAAFGAKVDQVTDPVKTSRGYDVILVTKLGKDIPAGDRAKYIESYETGLIQKFLQQVVDKDNKVDNKLASLVPKTMSPGFGPPGGRQRQ